LNQGVGFESLKSLARRHVRRTDTCGKGALPVTSGTCLRAYKRRKEHSRARATKKSSKHHVHRSTFHLKTPLVPNRPEPPFRHSGRCSEAPGRGLTFPHKQVCHGNGANVLRKVLQISDETLIWGPSCLITCDSEYPRPRRWNASGLRPRQSGRSIHTGPDATMFICSARRRQATSKPKNGS
jgi:hypothetical protein